MADLSDALEKAVTNVGGASLALPLAEVPAPTGGATTDTECRATVNAVIARLVSLGLITEEA